MRLKEKESIDRYLGRWFHIKPYLTSSIAIYLEHLMLLTFMQGANNFGVDAVLFFSVGVFFSFLFSFNRKCGFLQL